VKKGSLSPYIKARPDLIRFLAVAIRSPNVFMLKKYLFHIVPARTKQDNRNAQGIRGPIPTRSRHRIVLNGMSSLQFKEYD